MTSKRGLDADSTAEDMGMMESKRVAPTYGSVGQAIRVMASKEGYKLSEAAQQTADFNDAVSRARFSTHEYKVVQASKDCATEEALTAKNAEAAEEFSRRMLNLVKKMQGGEYSDVICRVRETQDSFKVDIANRNPQLYRYAIPRD